MRPANDTNWITGFKISVTSSTNKVFNNGFQQVELSVTVTPKAGQEVADDQLDSIRLVTLDDDGNYKELEGELTESKERDRRFEYFPNINSGPGNLTLESGTYRRKLYVKSTRPGGSLDTIYAAISKDDETHYVTHTSKFNSFAIIESVARPRFTRDDFNFTRTEVIDTIVTENNGQTLAGIDRFDLYSLSFNDPRRRLVYSLDYKFPSGDIYFSNSTRHWAGLGHHNYYHVAFKMGEKTQWTMRSNSVDVNTRPGVMNFVRLWFKADSYKEEDIVNFPSEWILLDQYGNRCNIAMTQEDDGNVINFTTDN